MFEAAELGQKTSKAEYEAALPELRSRLLAAQRVLRETNRSVIVILSGVEGAGKSEVVNRLHEWLDARGLVTHAFWRDSDEEHERPRYWRFWRALPVRGTIGILFGSWYTRPIIDRVFGKSRRADLDRELQRIVFFERMLIDDGAVIIKLWLHLTKDEAKQRPKKGSIFGKFTKMYDRFAAVSERAIRNSDTAEAPWRIVEATDQRFRDLTVGRIVLEALESLSAPRATPVPEEAEESVARSSKKATQTVLDRIDLTKTISSKKYERDLEKLQAHVAKLAWKAWDKRRSTVIVFEGSDAAGKGGAIRRLIAPIDARLYRVISVAAPTDEERAHHYLWRFWRQLPRDGAMTLYDRSWYGRVLVERVEGFARTDEWSRAYREINDFEEQLVDHGAVLIKFWLHISKAEQLRRFKERQKIAFKQHKITDEDWRNREKWKPYELAVNDMVGRTSSATAPWTVVAANDKRLARLQVLETVVQALR
ncbi:MAG TPA: polyphosphate:AMP phosphotransferase [Thermoanaerobaculia bacterium]